MTAKQLFISAATDAGVSIQTAEKALAKFLEVGLVKFDPVNGGIEVLTSDVYLPINLRHAASI